MDFVAVQPQDSLKILSNNHFKKHLRVRKCQRLHPANSAMQPIMVTVGG
jgi:SOS-response transcriptional repressor LexA